MQIFLPVQKKLNEGQAVLAILLVMAVFLVVGLSIVSRSVTDIKISQQSQESARALWVAQGGLEQAIKGNRSVGSPQSPQDLGGVKYSVTKSSLTGLGGEFTHPVNLGADEPTIFWLINHDDSTGQISSGGYTGNSLSFFWGKEGTPDNNAYTPALEATLLYKDQAGAFLLRRYAYDPNSAGTGRSKTNFSAASLNCPPFGSGKKFAFCTDSISLPSSVTLYFVRLKLLFNTDTSHPVGVKGNADLPQQGNCFEASAVIEESGVTRKLRQCQLWKITPPIFDYVLFSGGNIQ